MADLQTSTEPELTTNMDSNPILYPTAAARRLSNLLPKPTDLRHLPNLEEVVGPQLLEQRPEARQPQDLPSEIPSLIIPGISKVFLDGRPVSTYQICNRNFNMETPDNETRSEFRRITVDGRRLKYVLEVIQQPERARACGAGPRSSADRRPVDPPPVVQLKVIDENQDQEVTMDYDAGFMLYASLEVGRPIAHGRMHSGPPMPVLSGVAVASTAYLDRPKPAGYFIFPDLSVRHEGWYRLKFSLFEAIKHPEDADAGRAFVPGLDTTSRRVISHESMANRMEVQSRPFQVFSAKKFPGLETSTSLSRTVAEQGCRVRIRRDIRQRKRTDDKPGPEGRDDGQPSYRATPEVSYVQCEHARSASRNSLDSAYAASQSFRRGSIDSTYGRPAPPSRNPSIASLTLPSPTTPSLPQMMPMAPPPTYSARSSVSNTYNSPRGTDLKSYQLTSPSNQHSNTYPQPTTPNPNVTLAPMTWNKRSEVGFNPATRQYNLREVSASKRSYSPHSYYSNAALKSGARPDTTPTGPRLAPNALMGNGTIEADTEEEDDDEDSDEDLEGIQMDGEFNYPRADGSRGSKIEPTPRSTKT